MHKFKGSDSRHLIERDKIDIQKVNDLSEMFQLLLAQRLYFFQTLIDFNSHLLLFPKKLLDSN